MSKVAGDKKMKLEDFLNELIINLIPPVVKFMSNINHKNSNKKLIVDIVFEIYSVTESTKFHIQQNNGNFVASKQLVKEYASLLTSLSKLKSSQIPIEVPEYLNQKIQFWINPEAILADQALLRQIPTLDEIKNQCKNILYNL